MYSLQQLFIFEANDWKVDPRKESGDLRILLLEATSLL